MYNSIYPTYVKPYSGLNNRQITRKRDEEKNPQSSNAAENNLQQENSKPKKESYFPTGEKVAIDYTKRQIGIEQVLKDFRNTTNAIGAPDEVRNEVESYLGLIENQAKKGNPNQQIIQSNLKSASQILDEYITNTLKKPSKVVENWVDALFLQQIDYKSAEVTEKNDENTEIAVSEASYENVEAAEPGDEEAQAVVEGEIVEASESTENGIYVPADATLRRMFIQAKKYAAIDNKERALYSFQNTMEYADEIGDVQACAMIHFEEGRLYDDFNQLEDALYNYDRAAKQSNDDNIKARAHLSMGKIYDDFVYFEPAFNHYAAAVSFSGEADNLKLQTQALANLAKMHSERYDRDNTMMFVNMASTIADETGDTKVKAVISSKNAKTCERVGERLKALKLYGVSADSYSQIEDNENLAKNYRSAAEVMAGYGNIAKAKKLMSKAYIAAQNTQDADLKQDISKKLAAL